MRGVRHSTTCLCGCQHIEEMPGVLVRGPVSLPSTPSAGFVVYRFPKRSGRGTQDVAYTLDEIPVDH